MGRRRDFARGTEPQDAEQCSLGGEVSSQRGMSRNLVHPIAAPWQVLATIMALGTWMGDAGAQTPVAPPPPPAEPAAVAPAALDPKLPTVFVAGDSTAARNGGEAVGWGVPFETFFDPPRINVANRALGGRSSRTFVSEGLWEKLLAEGTHVDAIVSLTEASTRGAFYALIEFDRTRSTPLVGFDQNILAPVRTGEIDSVVILNTYQMGRSAMRLMADQISGNLREQYVIVQPQLVTRETIDSSAVRETLDLNWFM